MECANCGSTECVSASMDVGVVPRRLLYFSTSGDESMSAQEANTPRGLCPECWEVTRVAMRTALNDRARRLGLPRQTDEELQGLLDGVYARGGVPNFLGGKSSTEEEEDVLGEEDDEDELL